MHIELLDPLPCPSCGSTDVYCEKPDAVHRNMVCFICKYAGPIVPSVFEDPVPNIMAENRAVKAWNEMVKEGPKSKAQKDEEEERLILQQIYGEDYSDDEEKLIELDD